MNNNFEKSLNSTLLFFSVVMQYCGIAQPVNRLGELAEKTGRYRGLMAPTTITENIDIKCRGSDINCIDLAGPTARLTDKSCLAPLLDCPKGQLTNNFRAMGMG